MDQLIAKLLEAAVGGSEKDVREAAVHVAHSYAKTRELYHPSEELRALVLDAVPADAERAPLMSGDVLVALAVDLLVAAHTLTKRVGAYPVHQEIKRRHFRLTDAKRAERICRWQKTKKTDDWITGCTGSVQEEYYGLVHPDHCPVCGGKVVLDDVQAPGS